VVYFTPEESIAKYGASFTTIGRVPATGTSPAPPEPNAQPDAKDAPGDADGSR
jgi:hypothetical protein